MCIVIFTLNVTYLFSQIMVITLYIIQTNWDPELSAKTVRSGVGAFPLGLEGNSLLVPVIDGEGDCVHGQDLGHEGGRNASGEVPDKDILVSDASEERVVLEMRDILDKGWRVGIVLSLGQALSGEPGNSVARGVMVFKCSFELHNEVKEGAHGYGGS